MSAGAGPLEPVAPVGAAAPVEPVAPAAAVVALQEAAADSAVPLRYVGLATRVISFTLDAAVVNLVAIIVSVGAALILSLLHLPSGLKAVLAVIGGVIYVAWIVGYFAVLWSTTGQTPGARVMQLRVQSVGGGRLKLRRALLRCAGVFLAAIPLFAGFVPILFDDRRRGFQDWLARTVVVEAPDTSYIAARRVAAERARNQPSEPWAPAPPT
jgi:uncharacterized RDD family membrane protein YckC